MNKKKLLQQLNEGTWVRLGISTVCVGIGVFAIKDIPKGEDPFKNCRPIPRWITLTKEEVDNLPEGVAKLVDDMCVLENKEYYLPDFGINQIDLSFMLNHNKNFNMLAEHLGEKFITARDIKCGEELLVDYDTYDENVHNF